jgi:hypothetical protein
MSLLGHSDQGDTRPNGPQGLDVSPAVRNEQERHRVAQQRHSGLAR